VVPRETGEGAGPSAGNPTYCGTSDRGVPSIPPNEEEPCLKLAPASLPLLPDSIKS
jgi:hypothetical protein